MHFAFGRVRRRIALLRTGLFVVGQFIARRLPIYLFKLHQTEPTGSGTETGFKRVLKSLFFTANTFDTFLQL